ncbi:GNAT family N-acetyltransferase [Chitinophaga pendula]|uniref:GNAT family N-acetyltransferase n=1 Tax=Chitinophaga TaxID=79328 RepID=UPI000BB03D26|nr:MULTISPECIES: GNAT family N-acetyltransferase [Chitinophaga]ASZ13348.1 N-acetyltransferase [Chitinophaga sp. MD30]UCJ09027.1 GNAT family N-acetyltransferase [Chitinophaga pendula]
MLTFRHASEADLPAIVDIYNSTIPGRMVTADTEPVTVASREAWYHAHSPERRPLWMMELDGQVAGWISLQNFYGRPAYNGTAELSIYLHKSSRGKGLGRKALQFAIDQCPSLGVNNLMGIIFAHNEPSIKLFQSMGFEQWAFMPDIAVLDNITRSVVILGKKI